MIILDGGMSRELQRIGAPFRQPEWSALALIETPALVEQVHREFAAAGADVITTNSYALVPFHIGEERFRTEAPMLAARAGEVARQAADAVNATQPGRAVRVAGSLPPIFGSYQPELFDAATVQDYLSVLVIGLRPAVDLWLGETLSSLAEARAVLAAVDGGGRPVWISFTLDDAVEGRGAEPRLRSGETVAEAAAWVAAAGIDTLLFNCSQPEVMAPAVRAAAKVFAAHKVSIPIGVYANAFEPQKNEKANETLADVRQDLDGSRYSDWADEWVAAGASIIGGCCGIGVHHIHALSQHLRAEAVSAK
ncbi:homocysteine S-methyltransferase family protein [Acidisoma cellulosilytica]|uniref:Homocysteine S-methyltransferase family protein n=1 Tax=Acidisoma cellulosilyticum TaxID=2802395 RepID=A0A963Z2I6_9PROT|nr:homocysteine S-methyltransferase family protein [Acidisoma cellulosilyticum]MCB8881539.1 homocysteine S-methyltransferase family protein [Acidisoma cellulosilyticum]